MLNLLTDPVIPVERAKDARDTMAVSLPDLFRSLRADEVECFPGLAAHQAQAWYQFLAQLGAVALRHGGLAEPPSDPRVWRDLFSGLAPGCADTAWSLVVDDSTRPAFLQPPTGMITAFKCVAETPDALDILVTAKNHDRKQSQARGGEPHLWLYALVALQTTQGFSGRGNHGIARMNGGFSSRVLVDRRPGPRWGLRLVRAIRMLLARRNDVLRHAPGHYRSERGLALTWLRRWDTDAQLQMRELDPYFIEVCRRIRLRGTTDTSVRGWARPTGKPRVNARLLKGNLGDPWVPIKRHGAAALTVSGSGFDYRLAHRILFDDQEFRPPLSLRAMPWERNSDSELHMAVLVRGQGKTEGLHERVIPLPQSCAAAFDSTSKDDDERPSLSALSEHMVKLAADVRTVLRQTVLVFLQGPDDPDFRKPDASPVLGKFDRTVDQRFFGHLFDSSWTGVDRADLEWQRHLRGLAIRLARKEVWGRMTPPSSRREKARAASEAVLFGGLRKRVPRAFAREESNGGSG